MIDKREFFRSLMGVFVEELHERVQALNQDLLALEHQPPADRRAELLKTLFRSLHSLKGAARSVNAEPIESACHSLEEVFTAVREGRVPTDAGLFALAFDAVDAIQDAGARLRAEQDVAGGPLAAVLDRLRKAIAGDTCGMRNDERGTNGSTTRASPPAAERASAGVVTAAVQAPPAVTATPRESPPTAERQPASNTTPPLHAAPVEADPSTTADDPPPVAVAASTSAAATIRVSADKLDELLARTGELLVARRRVESRAAEIAHLRDQVAAWAAQWRQLDQPLRRLTDPDVAARANGNGRTPPRLSRRAATLLDSAGEQWQRLERDLERLARDTTLDQTLLAQAGAALEEEVHRVRMLPFGDACRGLERAARDVARAGGKQVELIVEGEEVEVDRTVLDGLKDPLLHLVRNAVDHGLEAPEQRRAAGKPPTARITVSAALRGPQVEVVVADDGRGLDWEAIRAQARRRDVAAPQDDRDLAQLLFLPGFSTAKIITDVSGRGVGLDVVQAQIEALHGAVEVHSEAGRGTRFTLTVPLTLTTINALLVRVGGQTLGFSSANVRTLVRFAPADVRRVAGREVLPPARDAAGPPVPLAHLADVLGRADAAPINVDRLIAVVVAAGDRPTAFVVDEVLGEQQIVVKSLGARIRRARLVSGATLLPSGGIALVLNTARLVQAAEGRTSRTVAAAEPEPAERAVRRLLVAEDSVTTRTLMKSILESHGYDVTVAVDGQDAWTKLQERACDLVVSDIDMPGMSGFALTEAIRGAPRLRELPVVLLTARDSDEDKARGVAVRADAYLVKSAFDQRHLLETIAQLL